MITIAPELPGALELIAWLRERGVATSIGHSAATVEEARAATAAGGTSTTHLFNAMTGVDHRAPGVAVAALLDDAAYVELIADGIHVDRGALAAHHPPQAGRPAAARQRRDRPRRDGRRARPGRRARGRGRRTAGSTLAGTSTLAGSVLALDVAVRNLVGVGTSRSPPPSRPRAATRWRCSGSTDRGRIAAGQRADLVELDGDLRRPPRHAGGSLVRRRSRLTRPDGPASSARRHRLERPLDVVEQPDRSPRPRPPGSARRTRPSPRVASPHVPDRVARWTEPGAEKKNAVWTGAGLATSGNGGNSTLARSMSTRAGLIARTADVSPRFAWSPVAGSKNSAASAGVIPSQ